MRYADDKKNPDHHYPYEQNTQKGQNITKEEPSQGFLLSFQINYYLRLSAVWTGDSVRCLNTYQHSE